MNWILRSQSGREFPINQPVVTLGSDPQNDIVVPGALAAHASLFLEQGNIRVVFWQEQGKTREQALRAGQPFRIGPDSFSLCFPDQTKGVEQVGNQTRVEGLLSGLEELLGTRKVESVSKSLLRGAVEMLDCDGGYMIAKMGDDLDVIVQWPEAGESAFSRTAAERALASEGAFQWFEGDESSEQSQSMMAHSISGVLCSALRNSAGEIQGVFYLHRRARKGIPFRDSDLAVFGRLCKVLGLLMEEIRVFEQQKQEINELRTSQGLNLVFFCPQMEQVMEKVRRVSPSDIPVLLQGETGTGKEVIARTVHATSNRGDKPFVAVNCGAIPSALLESELFGHMKGSFTGAVSDRKGFFEQAHGGTLFLDEIGELPVQMQVALLRVLQEHRIRRVGGTSDVEVDVRLIFATNRILSDEVNKGSFRQDLFYRISVFLIEIPPLRERGRDVLLLAGHFLAKHAKSLGKSDMRLSSASEKAILSAAWMGNVRELENRIQRGILNANSRLLTPEDMGLAENQGVKPLKDIKEDAEREAIAKALSSAKGNLTLAAQMLNIDRKVLRDIMKRLEISKDVFKG